MYYYRVPAKITSEGIIPDIPAGVNWVGNANGTRYLIKTSEPIPGLTPLTDVTTEAQEMGLDPGEVTGWTINGQV